MERLTIVKIGGKVIDSKQQLAEVLADFAKIDGHKLLVHGGGTLASEFGRKIGLEAKMVDGRRITDADSLEVVTMIYAGLINKKIVATLQGHGCNALGLSGADGNSIKAHKRVNNQLDYGFVGDIDEVNTELVSSFLNNGLTPVFSAITHNMNGQLLNTNADTIASVVAVALANQFSVKLVITFEQNGVLADPKDHNSVIHEMRHTEFKQLQADGAVSDGMVPKLDNGFNALNQGVKEVIITSFNNIAELNEPHTKLKLA
jgi:acetylglutamate kinase